METRYILDEMPYLGYQLKPHWIYNNFDLLGDALIAFSGECRVALEHMVDLADVKDGLYIYSPRMLHFIGEFFDPDLEKGVFRQRLLVTLVKETLESYGVRAIRQGDDLYVGRGKLSVSIATASPVSTLIHLGLNIETEGTPVVTRGLKDLGIDDIETFAGRVLGAFADELKSIQLARCKVRTVADD